MGGGAAAAAGRAYPRQRPGHFDCFARVVISGDYKRRPDPPARPSGPATAIFITGATFGLRSSAIRPTARRSTSCCSLALFSDRCHVVGVRRWANASAFSLLRRAGYENSLSPWRADRIDRALWSRIVAGPVTPARRCFSGGTQRAHRAGAAGRDDRPLVAPVARSGRRDGVGLDASAPAPKRAGSAPGDLRSRRLRRADGDDRPGRRRGDLGHPWPRRGAGTCTRQRATAPAPWR